MAPSAPPENKSSFPAPAPSNRASLNVFTNPVCPDETGVKRWPVTRRAGLLLLPAPLLLLRFTSLMDLLSSLSPSSLPNLTSQAQIHVSQQPAYSVAVAAEYARDVSGAVGPTYIAFVSEV